MYDRLDSILVKKKGELKLGFPRQTEKKVKFTKMHVGLFKVHRLTFLSSPPVAAILLHLCPIVHEVTFDPCAINSALV